MGELKLRKLKRTQLLEMLLEEKKENDRLRERVTELEQKLADRRIELDEAGSIAEAALRLNRIFEAAQEAAQQYLDNVKDLHEHQEERITEKLTEIKKEKENE
jgi:glutathione S-transferase